MYCQISVYVLYIYRHLSPAGKVCNQISLSSLVLLSTLLLPVGCKGRQGCVVGNHPKRVNIHPAYTFKHRCTIQRSALLGYMCCADVSNYHSVDALMPKCLLAGCSEGHACGGLGQFHCSLCYYPHQSIQASVAEQ